MFTAGRILLLSALFFIAGVAIAQTQPTANPGKQLVYHAVGIDVLPTTVLREPRVSYEYRKNHWGARGIVGYRIPIYKGSNIDTGNLINYDLYHARRGSYFGVGLNHYFPHTIERNYILNLLLGLQLSYHNYRMSDKCLYDGYHPEEPRSYRLLDQQVLTRKSARLVVGLSVSSSLIKKVSILTELYLGAGLGFDTIHEKGIRVSNSPELFLSDCSIPPDGAVVEPVDTRYYEGVIPFEVGLRVNYLVKKRIY